MAAQVRSGFRFRLAQGGVFTPEGFDSASSSVYELVVAAEERRVPRGSASVCAERSAGISDACRAIVGADLRERHIGAVVMMDVPGADAIADLFTSYYREPPTRTGGIRLWLRPPS
jgi:hypothetical protein